MFSEEVYVNFVAKTFLFVLFTATAYYPRCILFLFPLKYIFLLQGFCSIIFCFPVYFPNVIEGQVFFVFFCLRFFLVASILLCCVPIFFNSFWQDACIL